jgi:subtilisin family serine protease
MPVVHNEVEAYQGDELVVEQRHAGLVHEELRRLGVASTELDSSTPLRLSLLGLPNIESAAALLRQDTTLVAGAARERGSRPQTAKSMNDLDVVLGALRQSMRAAFAGWVATVGKNRVVDQVEAAPYIKGSIGYPAPTAPVSIPAATGQAGARVAILDTRLVAHPDLAGRYLADVATDAGPAPRSTQAHSTFIAGLVAQRAPTAELVVRTVLDDEGLNASSWDVATRMVGILDADVAVLNLSLCCATADGVPPLCLARAVERLVPSVVVVAAAGNIGAGGPKAAPTLTANTPQFPAAIDGVVGVGAYDSGARAGRGDRPIVLAPFSPAVPWVDLLAPGVDVRSTFLPGTVRRMRWDDDGQLVEHDTELFPAPGYASWSGTSFAAAGVSGAIAALVVPGHVSAYEALDQLRNPAGTGGDIVRYLG